MVIHYLISFVECFYASLFLALSSFVCFAVCIRQELLGLTGVEDKLQDHVKSTLETLRHAGIRVWMLTGDKSETALNIGISARLIDKNQQVFPFVCGSVQEAVRNLDIYSTKCSNTVLIIDGSSLTVVLEHEQLHPTFVEYSSQAPAVICCRCSPTQKAQMVQLVKQYTGKLTAAIGDGGNDVSMILVSRYKSNRCTSSHSHQDVFHCSTLVLLSRRSFVDVTVVVCNLHRLLMSVSVLSVKRVNKPL